jgi:hypothetical protein
VTFPLHAALVERLKRVQQGRDVLIRYTGKQTSNSGRVFKAFEVYVAGDDPLLQTEPARFDGEAASAEAGDDHC